MNNQSYAHILVHHSKNKTLAEVENLEYLEWDICTYLKCGEINPNGINYELFSDVRNSHLTDISEKAGICSECSRSIRNYPTILMTCNKENI